MSKGSGKGPAKRSSRSPRRRQPLAQRWAETGCDCELCRHACLNSPGWFLPREIPRLAAHLGLELPELFRKYLGLSVTATPGGGTRQGVMPHKLRDGKKPGGVWALAELAEPGRCVFYDHGRCAIYPVRPFECARMHHEHSAAKTARLRADVAATWSPRQLAPFQELARAAGSRRREQRTREQRQRRKRS